MTISLSGIPGIGPSTARVLMENGFKSANEIAQASIAQLVGVPGFSTARASRTIKAANELLSASAHAANSTTQPAPSQGRAAKIPVPKSPTDTTADNDTKETEIKKVTKKEPEELEKAKAKEAKKAKKAKKTEKAEKAAEKKAEKAKKAAAEKAKKVAAKKARTAKKAAKKKAKASAKKSRK
jgi:colicin import membrane protein